MLSSTLHRILEEASLQVSIFSACEFLNTFTSASETTRAVVMLPKFLATDLSVPFSYQGEGISTTVLLPV